MVPPMSRFLAPLLIALAISACAPSTPEARIQREPEKFNALPPRHQELARQGQITRGMNRDAVYFAWGGPARRFEGSKNGKPTERWDYAGSRPVYVDSFYGGYGYGFSPYGPYRSQAYYGFGPEVAYVPYRIASVWFIGERVDSWERAR